MIKDYIIRMEKKMREHYGAIEIRRVINYATNSLVLIKLFTFGIIKEMNILLVRIVLVKFRG